MAGIAFTEDQVLNRAKLLMLALSFLLSSCHQQRKSLNFHPINDTGESIINHIIENKFEAVPVPGLAVGIVSDTEEYLYTLGHSDLSTNAVFTDSTSFCAGVLSETMTASLALALEHNYTVNLDEPVSRVLSHFALNSDTYQKITLQHLLTNTSGVPKLNVTWDYPNLSDSALYQTTWSIRLLEPEFPTPGTQVIRSSYNFDIAADFISNASRLQFDKFADTYMFQPLQMKQSTYKPSPESLKTYSKPHEVKDWLTYAFTPRSEYPLNGEHAGSIGFHTTLGDLTKWMSMILNNGQYKGKMILPENLATSLTQPKYATNTPGSYIGLGLEIKIVNDIAICYKTGQVGGFEQSLLLVPALKIGIVVITNASSDFQTEVFAHELLTAVTNKQIPKYKKSLHIKMGEIYKTTSSIDSVLQYFEANMDNQQYEVSDLTLSHFGMTLFHRLNKKQDALQVYLKGNLLFPQSAYIHLNLAEYYIANRKVEDAERELSLISTLHNNEFDVIERIELLENAITLIKEKENY